MTAATLLGPEILKAVILHASPKTSKTQLQSMIGCVKIELVYVKTRKLKKIHEASYVSS